MRKKELLLKIEKLEADNAKLQADNAKLQGKIAGVLKANETLQAQFEYERERAYNNQIMLFDEKERVKAMYELASQSIAIAQGAKE